MDDLEWVWEGRRGRFTKRPWIGFEFTKSPNGPLRWTLPKPFLASLRKTLRDLPQRPSLQNPDRKGRAPAASSRNLIAPTKLGFVFSKERFATYLSSLTPAESKITPRSHRVAGSAPNPGCRRVLSEAAQRSSSIQAGAWSLEFSSPRTHRSTPPSTSRSDSTGERRK